MMITLKIMNFQETNIVLQKERPAFSPHMGDFQLGRLFKQAITKLVLINCSFIL